MTLCSPMRKHQPYFPMVASDLFLWAASLPVTAKRCLPVACLAYSPELKRRRFHIPLRKCDFYDDLASCRDTRRKLEFWLDPVALQTHWDRAWNQWKHLMGTKIEVEGAFVQSGKYRKRNGEWDFVTWKTALPSRLHVRVPSDFAQHLEAARATHHRFGQYARALDQVRLLLEHRAVERTELQRICAELRIPGDFDVTQMSWRPDYDPFCYRQLSGRARRTYLFRLEYISTWRERWSWKPRNLATPTYIFAKPRSMDRFLSLYTSITKDLRRNTYQFGWIERLEGLKDHRSGFGDFVKSKPMEDARK